MEVEIVELDASGIPRGDTDAEMSELTEAEETPKPKRVHGNALRRTG